INQGKRGKKSMSNFVRIRTWELARALRETGVSRLHSHAPRWWEPESSSPLCRLNAAGACDAIAWKQRLERGEEPGDILAMAA
ncbi:MAG: hypothetical protein J2P13_10835, partial [Acidobacteria bacterium]|nr:hypothetical protein [Acidobacteriota bacterium]